MSAVTGAPADLARALGSQDLMKGTAADDDSHAADDRGGRCQEPAAAVIDDFIRHRHSGTCAIVMSGAVGAMRTPKNRVSVTKHSAADNASCHRLSTT